MPRSDPDDSITLVLYEDPLSAWCLVAERRIFAVIAEFDGAFRLRHAPFPLRPHTRIPSERERRSLAMKTRRAAREPEGHGLSPALWLSSDPPASSLPALAALAAARLQGPAREEALRRALKEAALAQGVNVARRDVLFELADRCGLDLARFAGAIETPWTERLVLETWRSAMRRGINMAPALVIGEEWLVTGARSVAEYREILKRYVGNIAGLSFEPVLH